MRDIFSILFGAGFTVAVAAALGSLVIGALRVRLYRLEAALFAFVVGAGCLSFLTALLCLVGVARKGVFQWSGAAFILGAWWVARGRTRRRELPAVPLKWWAAWWGVF